MRWKRCAGRMPGCSTPWVRWSVPDQRLNSSSWPATGFESANWKHVAITSPRPREAEQPVRRDLALDLARSARDRVDPAPQEIPGPGMSGPVAVELQELPAQDLADDLAERLVRRGHHQLHQGPFGTRHARPIRLGDHR